MENVNMDQLRNEMENAPTMDEAIDSIFGNDDMQKEIIALSKQIQLLQSGLTTPDHIASEYEYTYVSLSAELSNALDSWMGELAADIVNKNPNADFDTYLTIADASIKDLAEVIGDFLTRYHELGKEIPSVTTRLRNTPPKLKKVVDAYTKLYDDLNHAKDLAHQIVEILDTDPNDFDQMVMKRVLENESAGENNAQPAE